MSESPFGAVDVMERPRAEVAVSEPKDSGREKIGLSKGALYDSVLQLLSSSDETQRKGFFGRRRIFHKEVVDKEGNEKTVKIWGSTKRSPDSPYGMVEMSVPDLGRIGFECISSVNGDIVSVDIRNPKTRLWTKINDEQLSALTDVLANLDPKLQGVRELKERLRKEREEEQLDGQQPNQPEGQVGGQNDELDSQVA